MRRWSTVHRYGANDSINLRIMVRSSNCKVYGTHTNDQHLFLYSNVLKLHKVHIVFFLQNLINFQVDVLRFGVLYSISTGKPQELAYYANLAL